MPHPVDIHVGKRLRMRRISLGKSQEAIGAAIGVTFQQIQKYERGTNRVGASRLYDFSKVLTVPVNFFYDDYDAALTENGRGSFHVAEREEGFEHERLTSRESLEVMRAYYSIKDPKVRKKMLELMRSMAEETEYA